MVDVSKVEGRLSNRRKLEEMSWPQVRAAIDAGQRTLVAAAGSMEQHGPHLPMQTDTLLGSFLAEAVVERLPGALQGPTIPFGVSEHHMPFAGTITLDKELFKSVVRQYVASLASHGFETIVIVPSHGGNFAPLNELLAETGGVVNGARFLAYTDLNEFIRPMFEVAAKDGVTAAEAGAHAGEAETSMVLAANGALVEMDYAEEGYVGDFGPAAQKVIFEQGMVALTSNGILGDARPATAERGFAYRERMADMLADWIRERLP
ncbi:MAG TPA: creatininase family protein [Thermomicrobiales bacterium]|nr:creatininase family protein [Thermomicrobiales bacterium]HQZ89624.1 creatininase family protein [Thermomicrobiales bacterium]HRA32039.1 creatininase family protein [Thermomicrobiales bacterium]